MLQVKPTEASYTLRDPHEVLTFLTRLVEWGQSPANAWHQRQSCIGWALNTSPSTPSCSQNGIHVDEPQANGDGAHCYRLPWLLIVYIIHVTVRKSCLDASVGSLTHPSCLTLPCDAIVAAKQPKTMQETDNGLRV